MPRAIAEKRSYWRGVLRRQRESGLSVRQFCTDESLCYASHRSWSPCCRTAGSKSTRNTGSKSASTNPANAPAAPSAAANKGSRPSEPSPRRYRVPTNPR